MSSVQKEQGLSLDQEVDLLEYLHALLAVKYLILATAVALSLSIFGLSKLIDNKYAAVALVAINLDESPGGIKPGSYRGSDIVSLIEHDFIINSAAENEKERLLARMRSTAFTDIFIQEQNLLKVIFKDKWNEESGTWIDGLEPSLRDANEIVRGRMRTITVDQQTGLLKIRFETPDPTLSAALANAFWPRFNRYVRQLEADELARRNDYLADRLEGLDNLEMQRSIYRLMETQLAAEALLFSRHNYPLEEIQPARPPLEKSYPSRKLWSVMGFVTALALGVVFALGRVLVRKLSVALSSYSKASIGVNNEDGIIDLTRKEQTRSEPSSPTTSSASVLEDEFSEWVDKP